MLVEHRGRRPHVHESVWVAPTAVPCGVVHVSSTVADGAMVPIGWVAVGDQVLPPDRHDEIWAIQRELDFSGTVYGESRGDDLMRASCRGRRPGSALTATTAWSSGP